VDTVGGQNAEVGIEQQLLEDPLRIALALSAAGGIRAQAADVGVEQRVLRVMGEESEPVILGRVVPDAVEIVGRVVGEEVGDRGVEVAPVVDDQHVVDQVDRIEIDRVVGIARAVGVVGQHLLVERVDGGGLVGVGGRAELV